MNGEPADKALAPQSIEYLSGTWLPIRLTALLLLFDMVPVWYLSPLMISLVGLGLVFPFLLRTPAVWEGILLVLAMWIASLWPLVDNHIYLLGYWTLAIVIAMHRPDPHRALAVSARWLIVFVFLWASLWKGVLSPDFRDGRFFTVRLMSDPRFEEHAMLLSGLTQTEVRQNRAFLDPRDGSPEEPRSPEEPDRPTAFQSSDRFRFWVTVFTWGLLLAEAGVALVFLLPWGRMTTLLRHGVLMAFCLATFAFAPVPTFGWLLLILGLAQVDPNYRRLRAIYVAVWFLIAFVSQAPWAVLLA
jgi:hypothetical protein